MQTRYYKVVRDLTIDYSKNLMLILAISVGVFGIGSILGGYSVIKREMTANYLGTVPASATIEIEGGLTKGMVDSIKQFPGIKEAERHATVLARMKVKDKWYPLLLFIVDDFKQKKTNKFSYLSGAVEPPNGTMLAERTAYLMMQANEGDEIIVKTPNGKPHQIKLAGTVHDPGLAPAWQEQSGYGYITMETLHALGETQNFDQLRILVTDEYQTKDQITEKAKKVADKLKIAGYKVHEIQVPPPGKHPHQGQMTTVLYIFIVFSFLILILSSILVSTTMATLMVKQIRQIGVMKTIGATASQINKMYFTMTLVLWLLAIIVAVPLSRIAASGFYNQLARLLNLELRDTSIPYWVGLIQIACGIIIPLLAVAVPVLRATSISVRKAIDNKDVSQSQPTKQTWIVKFSQLSFISETFRLALRNVFRHRSRLIMTVGLLAAGGAMFMTAMNVSEAWDKNLKKIYLQRQYDLEIKLNNPIHGDTIIRKIKKLPGVKYAEGWNYSPISVGNKNSFEITNTYPDKGHGSFTMLALPLPTQLLVPTVVEGKWLANPEANEVVLNQSSRGSKKINDKIMLTIEGKLTTWKVVGFTEDVGSPAMAFVSLNAFSKLNNTVSMIRMLRVGYMERSRENAVLKNKEVETLLEKENISVNSTIPVWLLQNAIAAHMRVLVNSLLAMALLMAVVGALGLMSSMSMNMLERTREVGIMRAIGATPKKIKSLVVGEGLLIGFLSILIAISLSLILSTYMGRLIGNMSFRIPLSLTVSMHALVIWIFIVGIGAYFATILPAKRANKINTREALAYE